jgi:hypothetical protein
MADDRPRPTQNDNKDAENRMPRDDESGSEAEPDSEGDSDSETPPDGESQLDNEAEPDVDDEEATDTEVTEAAAEVDGQPAEVDGQPAEVDDQRGEVADQPAEVEDQTGEVGNSTAGTEDATADDAETPPQADIPEDVRKYERFKKMDGAQYDRVNEFLRERTYITAREWAIARLCADFRTETGVEMTKIGENLPELVPFMTDTYTPQAVNQARSSFETKVRQAGATFLYGAMSGFFTAEELDDMMYEVTEVAKFLLEVEGVDLSVEEELEAEDRISGVMREVQSASEQLRHDEMECPNCGHQMEAADAETADSGPAESDD